MDKQFKHHKLKEDLVTIRDYIRWALSRFNEANLHYGHGSDNAWDEAVYLVLQGLHLPLESGQELLDASLTEEERDSVIQIIYQRVVERKPLPYLTHQSWFAGLTFYVDERTIIPRSPLGELIQNQFSPLIDLSKTRDILDLCTGSGCIAIACAHHLPDTQVDAVDISPEAVDVATHNIATHHLKDRVNIIHSDLFHSLDGKHYDLIISNPPYVPTEEYNNLPEEFKAEPKISLEAGKDGLTIVNRILREAPHHLNPHGILIVEVGNTEDIINETYPNVPFTWLEFEHGGHGVFMLTAEQLIAHHDIFQKS